MYIEPLSVVPMLNNLLSDFNDPAINKILGGLMRWALKKKEKKTING
jgi:hypothetical protein